MQSQEHIFAQELNEDKYLRTENHPVMNEDLIKVYQEMLALSKVEKDLRYRNVKIYERDYIHELYTLSNKNLPHLVCIHGFGATSMGFLYMFQHLKDHFQVHSLDLFGMGLSSRGNWQDQMAPDLVISYFIDAIEQWRKKSGLTNFILLGHSFGGLLSSYYLEKYPQKVSRLILLSPAGVSKWTAEDLENKSKQGRMYFTCFGRMGFNMHLRPTKMVNVCCLGYFSLKSLNGKLKLPENQFEVWKKFIKLVSDQDVVSEMGFYSLIEWPESPVLKSVEDVLKQLRPTIPIDFFYGDDDWILQAGANRLSQEFKNIRVHTINNSGHQIMFNNPTQAGAEIVKICHQHY